MEKKFTRSSKDKKLAGVCGGIAKYVQMDATIIRLIVAIGTFLTGCVPGIICYLIMALIMPEE